MTDVKLDAPPPVGNPEYLKPPKNIPEKPYRKFGKLEGWRLQRKINKEYKKSFPYGIPQEPPEKLYPEPTTFPETLDIGRNRLLGSIKKLNQKEKLVGLGTESEWQKLARELTGRLRRLASLVSGGAGVGLIIALGRLASSEANFPLGFAGASINELPEKTAAVDNKTAANRQLSGVSTANVSAVSEKRDVSRAIKVQEIVTGIPRQYFDAAMFAQEKTGIPRSVILGIFRQESSMGTDPNLSQSPDLGPAQIRPATWATVSERVGKVTGEKPDPNNPKHAALAAALLLKDSGFRENGQKAIRIYHRGAGHWQDELGKDYFEKIVGYAVPFEEAMQNAGY